MNSIVQIILVTLLVVTIALSSAQITSQTNSAAAATQLQRQQQQLHQQQYQTQQQQTHRQRKHHHHHQHYANQVRHLETTESNQKRERLPAATHPDQDVELIAGTIADVAAQQQQKHKQNASTTRLRRISARDYYNKVTTQRRLNNKKSAVGNSEWSYNNYNIHTNTFGGPSVLNTAGKGDDNTHDVEFIGSSSSHNNEWGTPYATTTTTTTTAAPPTPARRGYAYSPVQAPLIPASAPVVPRRAVYVPATSAPPPLVPPRRGYATAAPATQSAVGSAGDATHTTEDPFESNSIGRNYPSDPKEMERRHICVQQRTIQMPVKTTEVYTRPIWKHISTPCQPQTHANQMCTRVQLVHEPAYRDVIRHKSAQQVTYDCCTGWTRETPSADTCMKPVCSTRCQNGGICSAPDTCSCASGFTGRYCEHDVNECKEEKPCDQTCTNTVGSYFCKCRAGFVLQADQQSCKKIDLHEDDAFEARDLENEIESSDDLAARLHKIERSLVNERVQTHELEKSLQATYHVVDSLKSRLSTLEKQQQDVNRLQSNVYATETRTNKLEGMLNMLMKCRNGPNAYCP